MRNNKTPNYGYKVCYREEGAKEYVRYFLTHNRKQAFNAMRSYIRYPPTARDGDKELVNPKWKVIPVSLRGCKSKPFKHSKRAEQGNFLTRL